MRKFITYFFGSLFFLLLAGAIATTALILYTNQQLPNTDVLKTVRLQVPMRIYSSDGKLIGEFGAKRRAPVELSEVPKPLIQAVLATEDQRFYDHPGVDFIGLVRAAAAVVTTGHKVQGASTITMQVARNFFLGREKTYSRKLREILLALKIDRELDKNKILELYLNKIYLGKRAYGMAAGAEVYFGKALDQLSLAEMATLAGLPQAPSRDNPINNPQAALKRRNHVLDRMREIGFINQTQHDAAIQAPLTASYHHLKAELQAPYVAEMVRQELVNQYGDDAYVRGLTVYTTIVSDLQETANKALQTGLINYSLRHGFIRPTQQLPPLPTQDETPWLQALHTLHPIADIRPAAVLTVADQSIVALDAQGHHVTIPWSGLAWARPRLAQGFIGMLPHAANEIVTRGDVIWIRPNPLEPSAWSLAQYPDVQGALVSMNPNDGAILSLTGGFDYNANRFNRATQAKRQPGSSFKPFIYAAALAKGYTLASIINDAPIVMRDSGEESTWRPHNDNFQFYGPTRLQVALTKSRNLVSIRLLRAIGIPYALRFLQRFGFNAEELPHSLSLALGSGSVTPLQLAGGYAVLANGGYHVSPYIIQHVTDQDGNIVLQANPLEACSVCITTPRADTAMMPEMTAPKVIEPQVAYLMTHALKEVIEKGTGKAAQVLGREDLSGKTGTTNNKVDAWFAGFNNDTVTVTWVGFDNLQTLNEFGADAALPIWIDYMGTALKSHPEHELPQPPGIVTVRIDPKTGLLAGPNQGNAIFQDFAENTVPREMASAGNRDSNSNSGGGIASDAGAGAGPRAGSSFDSNLDPHSNASANASGSAAVQPSTDKNASAWAPSPPGVEPSSHPSAPKAPPASASASEESSSADPTTSLF